MSTFTEILLYIAFITIIISSISAIYQYYFKLSPILIGANHKWDKKTDNFNLTLGVLIVIGTYFSFNQLVNDSIENKTLFFYFFIFFSFFPILRIAGKIIKSTMKSEIDLQNINFAKDEHIHFKDDLTEREYSPFLNDNYIVNEKSEDCEIEKIKSKESIEQIQFSESKIVECINQNSEKIINSIKKKPSIEEMKIFKNELTLEINDSKEKLANELINLTSENKNLNSTLNQVIKFEEEIIDLFEDKPSIEDVKFLKEEFFTELNDSMVPMVNDLNFVKNKTKTLNSTFPKSFKLNAEIISLINEKPSKNDINILKKDLTKTNIDSNELVVNELIGIKSKFEDLAKTISESNKKATEVHSIPENEVNTNQNEREIGHSIESQFAFSNGTNDFKDKLIKKGILRANGRINTDNPNLKEYHVYLIALANLMISGIKLKKGQGKTYYKEFIHNMKHKYTNSNYTKFSTCNGEYRDSNEENMSIESFVNFNRNQQQYLEMLLKL